VQTLTKRQSARRLSLLFSRPLWDEPSASPRLRNGGVCPIGLLLRMAPMP